MFKKIKIKERLLSALSAIVLTLLIVSNTFAEGVGMSMSPLNQKIILTPGETYVGSLSISNPGTNTSDVSYIAEPEAFYVDEDYNNVFGEDEDYNQITSWTTVSPASGSLSPNETQEIYFTINVPNDAPAGGQYMTIMVTMGGGDTDETSGDTAAAVREVQRMGHIVYAEIAGTTTRSGEIAAAEVPGFLLSGNIGGTSYIKNTGNVHGTATYTLQVFPLFSNEEVYTNEEDPQTKTILPDRTLMNTTSWENTPDIGIFNVIYTVEFEGEKTTVEKMVIKCPIWLLFIIIFGVILIIFWLLTKSKSRKKSKR